MGKDTWRMSSFFALCQKKKEGQGGRWRCRPTEWRSKQSRDAKVFKYKGPGTVKVLWCFPHLSVGQEKNPVKHVENLWRRLMNWKNDGFVSSFGEVSQRWYYARCRAGVQPRCRFLKDYNAISSEVFLFCCSNRNIIVKYLHQEP